MKEISLSAGDAVEVVTERLAFGGDAVAHYEGLTIFIPLAAPEERLRVRIIERKKKFARALVEEILIPSPSRREAPCPYFGDCGGCQLQHIAYPAQIEAKAGFVRDCLSRIGRIEWSEEIEVRSASEFNYRASAQVKLERAESSEGAELRIGFNRPSSRSVCDVKSCLLLVPALDAALGELRSSLNSEGDEKGEAQAGALSQVDIAAGESGVAVEPEIAGLPKESLKRSVGGATYNFSPSTFFQINPLLLDDLIAEAIKNGAGGTAIDLYAGVGLFTIQLARLYDRVIGVEADARAATFARRNIKANDVANARFYNAHAETWLENFIARRKQGRAPAIDLVLLDPPRSGAAQAVEHIIRLKPTKITYVSCDLATFARDLKRLLEGGYTLSSVTAFDLFPQTYHVEIVAHLGRREG
ncbi:MAG: class I SAM-dependent RNA methyltransferase [Blastocatellia bacterium]|nr:class I SAM-dependent RNA methyltransferase [Blastocatellia bacterium]